MRRPLLLPKLGLTMTEATLLEWRVRPGERFEPGQALALIESEKAAVEVPADAAGVLLEADDRVGQVLPVGTVIGHWDDGDADEGTAAATEVAVGEVAAGEAGGTVIAASLPQASLPPPGAGPRILATPLARRMAAARGIALNDLQGSGPRGRIRARDVEAAGPDAGMARSGVAGHSGDIGHIDAGRNDGIRTDAGRLRPASAAEQTIARRLSQSKQQIPHFYLAVEPEVSRLLALREELNAIEGGRRFTINHFILAAVGRALRDVPEANCVWTDAGILAFDRCDVGLAVDAPAGLVAPVLRDLGRASLADVAARADAAREQARAGRLAPADMSGGAITVSNAGMHDVSHMASIINPSQSMILGVGSVRALFRPDADGKPLLQREIGLVLSADHRVLDGVRALRLLKRITFWLEQPLRLLVA